MSLRALYFGALLAVGCARQDTPAHALRWEAAPARADVGELCLDVGSVRACWGGPCAERGCLVARPEERLGGVRSERCSGAGAARRCEARGLNAGPFVCEGERCVQRIPRAPDAGEWQCVDISGAVFCQSVVAAAGIPSGERDAAFRCGARRAHAQTICVDLAPDLPPGPGPWGCGVSYPVGVAERVCTRSPKAQLGDACSDDGACPRGSSCVSGRCLPPYPRAECWLDADCADGRVCQTGSCRDAP